ncbi:MAG: PAS domain-containing sensor histidine kinase [Mariprofundaceae bacterium]
MFFVALMLAESAFFYLTGHAVSIWAMVLAALAAAVFFSPMVHAMQRSIDRIFFRRHLDMLAAIRQLGAGDLADLPAQNIEHAVLERICKVSHRKAAALDERRIGGGKVYVYPASASAPELEDHPALRNVHSDYELCLSLPRHTGKAYLYLGPRNDGWPADDDEMETLGSLARFAAMSLEHARLSHQQIEAARLDSLTRVTRQLHSHDLKNRLHDLSFLAHHIGSGKLEAEDANRLVDAIRKVVGRMQTLMQRLADPRAPLNPSLAPLDLVALLHSSVKDRLWPEGIKVHRDIKPISMVSGDAEMLQGVLENLYDNAIQAMQGKGDLYIDAEEVKTKSGKVQAQIRVRDTGSGISASFLKHRLFNLFATNKVSGLGIGLYLSKRIVDAHGGAIAAISDGEGKGCTFYIRLPLWQAKATQKAESEA